MLTVERLRELFSYDPDAGVLTWRVELAPRAPVGSVAGYQTKHGNWVVQCLGKKYHVHRIIWAIVTGGWPSHLIDHADGNPANNRILNLREATHAENCRNRRKSVGNTSGFKGVRPMRGKWCATINAEGRYVHLGVFDAKEAAAAAYDAAAVKLHGAFARLNFPS